MKLPGDLSYGMPHENYYAEPNTKREINVTYRSEDLKVQVGFTFLEVDFDRRFPGQDTAVQLQMFQDSWEAWAAIPDLFSALALKAPASLAEVAAVLELFEASDYTAREYPGKDGPARQAIKAFQVMRSPGNARAAAEALLAFADDPDGEPPF